MAPSIWLLLPLVVSAKVTLCANSSDKLVTLECQHENHGVHGQKSLLKCSVKSKDPDMKILYVFWRRVGFPNVLQKADPRFQLANENNVDVSLILTDTRRTDEGQYKCEVITDSGEDSQVISLNVTALYTKPAMSSFPEKDIEEDMEVTLFCNASGGYPVGMIHWFDQYNTNWTRSAETTLVETTDKRFNLTSKFTLRARSSSPGYKCFVFSSDGVKEGETEYQLIFHNKQTGPDKAEGSSTTAVAAVIVIIGSLLCGLLILMILRKRRLHRGNYMEPCELNKKVFVTKEMEEDV